MGGSTVIAQAYISEHEAVPGKSFIAGVLESGGRDLVVVIHGHNNSSVVQNISSIAVCQRLVPGDTTITRDVEVRIAR